MNKKTGILSLIARFSGIVALIDLGILAIVGLIYWKSGGSTPEQFAEALEIAGFLAIGISSFGIKGNWDATRSFGCQYSMTTT